MRAREVSYPRATAARRLQSPHRGELGLARTHDRGAPERAPCQPPLAHAAFGVRQSVSRPLPDLAVCRALRAQPVDGEDARSTCGATIVTVVSAAPSLVGIAITFGVLRESPGPLHRPVEFNELLDECRACCARARGRSLAFARCGCARGSGSAARACCACARLRRHACAQISPQSRAYNPGTNLGGTNASAVQGVLRGL